MKPSQNVGAETRLLQFAFPILINMPERVDRLEESLAELQWVNNDKTLEIERDLKLVRPTSFPEPAGFVSAAFRSCLDAHLIAACWARDQGLERVLVLEDDIQFDPAWHQIESQVLLDLVDSEWDIATLGYLSGAETVTPAAQATPTWSNFNGETIGAHAYLLHQSFYDTWIEHLEAIATGEQGDNVRGPMAPDGAMNTITWAQPETNRLLIRPSLVGQRSSRSDITRSAVDRVRPARALLSYHRSRRHKKYLASRG